jgi:hypothetical protein
MKTGTNGEAALATTFDISVKGRRRQVPAFPVGPVTVIVRGRVLRVAEVFDEYWVESRMLPSPTEVIDHLKNVRAGADLFTFAQRAPQTDPQFNYHTEWDNVAAIPVTTHEQWLVKQISSASRRNVRSSEKKRVSVQVSEYDDAYVRGIMSIFNESAIRHGRKYWHYGKDFATVKAENETYEDRSIYLAAYFENEMIGYMKIVFDEQTAAIMQILSKTQHFDKRPNNAMLSEAVRLCAERKVGHLLYESFVYGNKVDSSLTRFKRENGFVRMDLPRYYVPLSATGRVMLRLGFHKQAKDRLPSWLTNRLLQARDKYYELRSSRS